MRPPFFRDSRLVIVAGKGGVGKTTVSAVTAAAAATAGMRTLLVGLEPNSALGGAFGVDLEEHEHAGDHEHHEHHAELFVNGPSRLLDRLDGQVILADRALHDWLSDKRMGRLADRLAGSGALDMIASAVPGIHDILLLGRIKAIVNEGRYDLVVVDGPASGHAVTMLHTAEGLRDSVSVGAIRQQADAVAAMLADPAITQVVLVTLPETTPVTETIETAFALEDEIKVRLGPVVINQVDAALATGIDLAGVPEVCRTLVADRAAREQAQRSEITRLKSLLPLQFIELPTALDASANDRRVLLEEALMSALASSAGERQ